MGSVGKADYGRLCVQIHMHALVQPPFLRINKYMKKNIKIPSLAFAELRVVSMEHFKRVWHANRER